MSRIIIAAASSGSGKTLITCGLLNACKNKKMTVNAYKCGPDYIDPMFHREVIGVASDNLDTFFYNQEQLNRLLANKGDISIVEGVMGIYDGLGGNTLEGSAYDLATKTGSPIMLVLDAHGIGRTMLSLIKGILSDDVHHLIKGIFLNQISESYFHTIAPLIEEETQIPVLGFLPKLKGISIESRHLGLKMPAEIENLKQQVQIISDQLERTMDYDRFFAIAATARAIPFTPESKKVTYTKRPRLAVAKDEAFCFYYQENLRILENAGAEIVYFSPLRDSKLPDQISGILLGGGYPELSLKELSNNRSMRESIHNAIKEGMPSLAECGGFMYLHRTITGEDQKEYEMVGVIDGNCYNTGKLCRFGYISIDAGRFKLKGHEFHYFDSTANGSDAIATKPTTQKQWNFGYKSNNHFWGFPHVCYASCEEFITSFMDSVRTYQKQSFKEKSL